MGVGLSGRRTMLDLVKREHAPRIWLGSRMPIQLGTAKDLLETNTKNGGVKVEWPIDDDAGDTHRVTDFFSAAPTGDEAGDVGDELGTWFGTPADWRLSRLAPGSNLFSSWIQFLIWSFRWGNHCTINHHELLVYKLEIKVWQSVKEFA